jgi:hypothetical protein
MHISRVFYNLIILKDEHTSFLVSLHVHVLVRATPIFLKNTLEYIDTVKKGTYFRQQPFPES